MQHVAVPAAPGRVAAEPPKREGRAAAEIQPARRARPRSPDRCGCPARRACPIAASAPRPHRDRPPVRRRGAPSSVAGMRRRPARSPSSARRSAGSARSASISSPAAPSALPTARLARRKRRSSIGPRRRHADIPVAEPAGPILHGGLRAPAPAHRSCAAR